MMTKKQSTEREQLVMLTIDQLVPDNLPLVNYERRYHEGVCMKTSFIIY